MFRRTDHLLKGTNSSKFCRLKCLQLFNFDTNLYLFYQGLLLYGRIWNYRLPNLQLYIFPKILMSWQNLSVKRFAELCVQISIIFLPRCKGRKNKSFFLYVLVPLVSYSLPFCYNDCNKLKRLHSPTVHFFSYHFETFVCFLGDHKAHFLLKTKFYLHSAT